MQKMREMMETHISHTFPTQKHSCHFSTDIIIMDLITRSFQIIFYAKLFTKVIHSVAAATAAGRVRESGRKKTSKSN